MRWWTNMRTLFRVVVPEPDPQQQALQDTLADLRRVSSELRATNQALSERRDRLKTKRDSDD